MRLIAASSVLCLVFSAGLQAAELGGAEVYHWGNQKVEVHPASDGPDTLPPAPNDTGCGVSGLLQAQGISSRFTYPNALPGADTTQNRSSLAGTAAANVNCGNWNFQGVVGAQDYVPYTYSFGNRGWNYTDFNMDGGVDVFWRDPNSFMIGGGVRRSVETEHYDGFGLWSGTSFDHTYTYLTGDVFAELYASDDITLGLTGFYETGDDMNGGNGIDYQLRNYGGSAYARYYWTPNLRLSLRGYITQTDDLTSHTNFSHMNAVSSVDYKFDSTPVTVFGGLRLGSNDGNAGSSLDPNSFVQGFVGVQMALGAHANGTQLERDRNGVNLH